MSEKATIRIKIDTLELEYEGSPDFLNDKLTNLLGKMKEISSHVPKVAVPAGAEKALPVRQGKKPTSISSFARYFDIKKSSEAIVCVIAYLELMQGKDWSAQQEVRNILKSMKYVEKSTIHNLTALIETLIKNGRIVESNAKEYYLSQSEKSDIEVKLANNT